MDFWEYLSNELIIPKDEISKIAVSHNRLFARYQIKKKGHEQGTRTIYSPSREARIIQSWLKAKIFDKMEISPFSYAYREKTSIKRNANLHHKNEYFIRTDFENFFPSIMFHDIANVLRLKGTLEKLNLSQYSGQIFYLIRYFCFGLQEELLQGFITSPVISNIVMNDFDHRIAKQIYQLSKDARYSRYADDLTISFNDITMKAEFFKLIKQNTELSASPRIKINSKKTRFGKKSGGSAFVNGLKITHDNRITLNREYKDRLRAMFHHYKQGRKNSIKDLRSILGHVYYVSSIDPNFYNKVKNLYFNEIETIKKTLKTSSSNISTTIVTI